MTLRPLVLLALIVAASPASASGPDYFGIGGRWQGAGGGGVAVVDDGTAAMSNPAGLARIRRPTAGLGFQAALPDFADVSPVYWDVNRDGVIDARDTPLQYSADPDGVVALQGHLGRHVGGKFGLGIAFHVPFDTLVRFKTFEPELPTYPMWDNRLERFALAAGVGGQILPGLHVGVGVDALAAAKLKVLGTADIGVSGDADTATDVDELVTEAVIDVHEIDVPIVPVFAPVIGIQWEVGAIAPPLDGLVLAAAYHGEVGLPIDIELDLQANVSAQDIGSLDPFTTALIIDADLLLFDHYVPQRISTGLAWNRGDTFMVYGDLRWTDWSRMALNIATLTGAELTSPLINVSDIITDGNDIQVQLQSTWGFRMGTELQLPEWALENDWRYVRLRARGGFGIEPSPIVAQGPDSQLLDAGRSYFTLGAGGRDLGPVRAHRWRRRARRLLPVPRDPVRGPGPSDPGSARRVPHRADRRPLRRTGDRVRAGVDLRVLTWSSAGWRPLPRDTCTWAMSSPSARAGSPPEQRVDGCSCASRTSTAAGPGPKWPTASAPTSRGWA